MLQTNNGHLNQWIYQAILRRNEYIKPFSDAMNENQRGFRKEYSTIDNLFIIHSLFKNSKF
jgi:hypothetical protein